MNAYTELDLRVGWRVRSTWELSLVGHNLLRDQHEELASPSAPRYAFRRSLFARSIWEF